MAHLKWTNDLNTGIEVIDSQHRRIVDYINALYDASQEQSREEIGNVLEELVDYTLSHFAFEEQMQEEAGYPFAKAHKKVHQLFARRVGEFQERFAKGEDISEQLLSLLRTWLVNHIRRDDADYVQIVKQNVLQETPKSEKGWWKKLFS